MHKFQIFNQTLRVITSVRKAFIRHIQRTQFAMEFNKSLISNNEKFALRFESSTDYHMYQSWNE